MVGDVDDLGTKEFYERWFQIAAPEFHNGDLVRCPYILIQQSVGPFSFSHTSDQIVSINKRIHRMAEAIGEFIKDHQHEW